MKLNDLKAEVSNNTWENRALLSKILIDKGKIRGLSDQVSSYSLEEIWSRFTEEEYVLIFSEDAVVTDVLNKESTGRSYCYSTTSAV